MKPLHERTPPVWADRALEAPQLLLLDHLQCEMKAATTALSLTQLRHVEGNPMVFWGGDRRKL